MTNHQSHRFNNIIDKYINICYICISYLFMIYKDKRSTRSQEAVHPDRFWVYRLFILSGFGGAERGERTGAGTENRSI